MYEYHFYKADWEELDRLIEAALKSKIGGKNEDSHKEVWASTFNTNIPVPLKFYQGKLCVGIIVKWK